MNKQKILKFLPTYFLRFFILLLVGVVLVFCIFVFPSAWEVSSLEFPSASYALKLIVIGLYVTVVPFIIGLWEAFRLLKYIDNDLIFSELFLKSLKRIKICAYIISVMYLIGNPLLFPIAQADDAPGLIIVGAVITSGVISFSLVINYIQRTLERILYKYKDIK